MSDGGDSLQAVLDDARRGAEPVDADAVDDRCARERARDEGDAPAHAHSAIVDHDESVRDVRRREDAGAGARGRQYAQVRWQAGGGHVARTEAHARVVHGEVGRGRSQDARVGGVQRVHRRRETDTVLAGWKREEHARVVVVGVVSPF